jgi:hypothetical protein
MREIGVSSDWVAQDWCEAKWGRGRQMIGSTGSRCWWSDFQIAYGAEEEIEVTKKAANWGDAFYECEQKMAFRRHVAGIEIIRGKNRVSRKTKLVLFINGRWVNASQSQIALLACLHDEIGYVVSYETLCFIIGHGAASKKQRHILRQYVLALKRVLESIGRAALSP